MSTTTKLRTRRSADESKQAILTQAAQHFGAKGFKGTRIEDIAQDLGMRHTAVLFHFKTKRLLYLAALRHVNAVGLQIIESVISSKRSPREKAWELIDKLVDRNVERPEVALMNLRASVSDDEALSADTKSRSGPYRRLFKSFLESIDPSRNAAEIEQLEIRLAYILFGQGTYFFAAVPGVMGIDRQHLFKEETISALKTDLFCGVCRVLDFPEGPMDVFDGAKS